MVEERGILSAAIGAPVADRSSCRCYVSLYTCEIWKLFNEVHLRCVRKSLLGENLLGKVYWEDEKKRFEISDCADVQERTKDNFGRRF